MSQSVPILPDCEHCGGILLVQNSIAIDCLDIRVLPAEMREEALCVVLETPESYDYIKSISFKCEIREVERVCDTKGTWITASVSAQKALSDLKWFTKPFDDSIAISLAL